MRKFATCLAAAALILSAGTASAETDFDALLGELNFGATPDASAHTLTLDDSAAEALAPAPEPIETPPGEPTPAAQPLTMPEMLQQPAYAQTTMVQSGCDTTQRGCDAVVSNQCAAGGCNTGGCGSIGHGTGCNNGRCGGLDGLHGYNCVPHTPPNLPKSTLRQYWKSDACNCRVWDGYQNRCIGTSKHSRGECDCFDPSKKRFGGCGTSGPIVYPASAIPCDAGSRLQLPAAWKIKGDCAGQADCAGQGPGCDTVACDAPCDS